MINKSIRFTPIATLITSVLGLLIILGWIFDSLFINLNLSGLNNFNFDTGIAFLFSSLSLFILDKQNPKRVYKKLAYFLSALVIAISLFTIIPHLLKVGTILNDLFINQFDNDGNVTYLRMYISTSILFLIFNLILFIIRIPFFKSILQTFTLITIVFLSTNFLISLAKLHFTGIDLFLKTALSTTLFLIIIFFGLLFSNQLIHLKISFWKKISACFILVLMVLVIIFISLRQNNQRAIIISEKIEHTNETILKLHKLLNLSRNVIASSRNFLISGEELYLKKYFKDTLVVHDYLEELVASTSDDVSLKSGMDSIRILVVSNIEKRNEINNLRLLNGFSDSLKTYEIINGHKKLEELKVLLDRIENKEFLMLSGLKINHTESVEETSNLIFLFQVIILLILIVAFISIINNGIRMKKVQDEISSARLFLENILENIPNMLFVKSASDLRFTKFNKAGEQLLGISKEEFLGKNDYDIFPEEQAKYFTSEDRKVFAQNAVLDFPEEKISTKYGERWLHTRKIPVKDSNGEPLYLIGISEDITLKKQFDDNLKKATAEIFDLYNNAPCGYHSINSDGLFISINNTELKWLGYERKEVIGKLKFSDLITEDSKERFLNTFEKFKKEGVIINREFDMVRKDGSIFQVILSASSVYDSEGNFLRSRSTVLDYTEPKRLTQQILKLNEELETRIILKTAKIKRSNEELERFAYVASHDLQEPLRMVSSFLNLLEKRTQGKLDETEQKYIHFAVDGAHRMKQLIQNLLEFSRLGTAVINFSELNCNLIIQNVLDLFKLDIEENDVELNIKDLPVINGNSSQIQQLFQNLIGNSLKYRRTEKLVIEIGFEDKNDHWQFYVKDNGLGIDPKFFDQIFVIFKRLHNSSEYQGTGVGLSICQKIVHVHGGKIWVESKLGKGSVFYFTIPKTIL